MQNIIYCVYDRHYKKIAEGTNQQLSTMFNVDKNFVRNKYHALKNKMTADKFPVFVRKGTEFDDPEKLREIISKGHKTYYLYDGIRGNLVIAGTGREVAEWLGISTPTVTNKHKSKTNIFRPKHASDKDKDKFFRLVVKEDTFESFMPEGNVYDYLKNYDRKQANFIDIKPFAYTPHKDWFDILNLNLVNLYKETTQTGLFGIIIKTFNGDIINEEIFHSEEERDGRYKELKQFKAKKNYGKLRFGKYECDISEIVTMYQITNDTMFILFRDGTEKKIKTKTKEGITNIFRSIQGEFIK